MSREFLPGQVIAYGNASAAKPQAGRFGRPASWSLSVARMTDLSISHCWRSRPSRCGSTAAPMPNKISPALRIFYEKEIAKELHRYVDQPVDFANIRARLMALDELVTLGPQQIDAQANTSTMHQRLLGDRFAKLS